MSKRPKITKELSMALEKYLNPKNDTRIYIAKEVTFDYGTNHATRVDYMRFKPVNNTVSGIEKGDFYCYEIKSSVEDFHSGHGLNFIGDYNYLVMPQEVYASVSKEIPYYVGVLVLTERDRCNNWRRLTVIKNAKRRNREKSMAEMLFMMFRSAARDRYKLSQIQFKGETNREKDSLETLETLKNKFVTGMNVHYQGDDADDAIECPICGYEVARNDDYEEIRPEHCPKCGTKLIY